jgi:hypothetical protein
VVLPAVRPEDPFGAPMWPELSFFERPADMEWGQKMLVRMNPEDPLFGQVFGYVAPKGQCILESDPTSCWMVPPSPTNYDYAHQGTTVLADGSILPTANLGGGKGHADVQLGWAQVPLFYENTSYQMAAVRYGEDDFGVYGVGVLRPEATWGQALEFVRSATSGDWRWVQELNAWDFAGSCLVNLPGFPMFDGTRVVMKASAAPLGQTAMLVTFSGADNGEADPMKVLPTSHTAAAPACACQSHTASPEVETPTVTPDVSAVVAAAIEANNAAWEQRLTDTVAPLQAQIDEMRPVVLSVLDA